MNTIFLLEDTGATNSWPLLVILGVFLIGMMAFSVIPQRRKQKQMAEMSSRIKVGDKIKTIGGIFGTITAYDEQNNVYTIESGNSTFQIDRGCVYSMEMMGIKPEETANVQNEEFSEEIETVKENKTEKEEKTEEKTEEDTDNKKE